MTDAWLWHGGAIEAARQPQGYVDGKCGGENEFDVDKMYPPVEVF